MKTYIITPLFCKAMLFYDQLQHMKQNQLLSDDMLHVVVNDHYPIDSHLNDLLFLEFTKAYGCEHLSMSKNVGMQGAVNMALRYIMPEDDDVIILSDVDDRASPGSYQALTRIIKAHDSIAVAALSFDEIHHNRSKLDPYPETQQGPHFGDGYWIHPTVDCWHIAAYRYSWIKSIGGFGQVYPYWGGLEAYLYGKWKPENKNLVYLTGYTCEDLSKNPGYAENKLFFDPEFKEYKNHIHTTQYKGSFEDWLDDRSV